MALRLGQKVPEFALPDADQKTRSLAELTKQGPLVLAFFPFAFSGFCDKEMCTFRDEFGALQEAGAQLVGISVDSSYSLKAFAQTFNLQFPLLSDFNKKTVKLYGVFQDPWVGLGYKGVAKRAIMVVDQQRRLRYRWVTDVPAVEPPYTEVVRAAQKLIS